MENNNLSLPPSLQLPEEVLGYEPGTCVLWAGVAGKVLKEKSGMIYVKFINHVIHTFHKDGRYLSWHSESSLRVTDEKELERQAVDEWKRRHNRD